VSLKKEIQKQVIQVNIFNNLNSLGSKVGSGYKLSSSSRVFKPPGNINKKPTTSLKAGRVFKPPQVKEEEKKEAPAQAQPAYGQEQYYGEGYPQEQYHDDGYYGDGYPGEEPDQFLEDDFDQFQFENEQLEQLNAGGEFGEGAIRFEPSSKDCSCCKGLVERCDGDICEILGECYCVSHNKFKEKS